MTRLSRLASAVALAIGLSVAPGFAKDSPTQPALKESLVLRVDGALNVNEQGVPTGYTISTRLPQALRAALQDQVRSWRFEPPTSNDAPTTAHLILRITLAADTEDDQKVIRIDNVVLHHDPAAAADSKPDAVTMSFAEGNRVDYPLASELRDVEADVLIYAHVTPAGRVDKAMAAQVALLNVAGPDHVLRSLAKTFENAAVSDVLKFRFHVAVDAKRLAALQAADPDTANHEFTVAFPVVYMFKGNEKESAEDWQQEVRTPLKWPEWIKPLTDCRPEGIADIMAREDYSLSESCLRLLTPVIGVEVAKFKTKSQSSDDSSGDSP